MKIRSRLYIGLGDPGGPVLPTRDQDLSTHGRPTDAQTELKLYYFQQFLIDHNLI